MKNSVVLITGASSGIGAALAREYARRGAILVLTARRADRLRELEEEIRAAGGRALAVAADVTRDGDLEAAVAQAVSAFGSLDVVIANAGFGVTGAVENLTLDDYARQFDTNVSGVLRTVKAAIPELRKSRGRIGVIGSVAGYIATPKTSAYCMSKFAVRALAESLRLELRPEGISVTHLAPGFVASEIRAVDNQGRYHEGSRDPMPPWLVATAESAAREIVDAVEARRRERVVTFHGKVLVWLQRHFPRTLAAIANRFGGARRTERARS